MLRAEEVSKTYASPAGDVAALQAFSYDFAPGKITVIKGPSGSGKSTLLNVLAGLDVPSGGSVWVNGTDLTQLPEAKRAELRLTSIGFVFQSFNLIAVLNARENVAFPLGLAGASKAERTEKAEALLTRFGLEHRLTHLPYKLSGGEKQRVALARALANNPDIIFADEPTGNLDSDSGAEVLTALRTVADEGRTVIVVTHDPATAAQADDVIDLKDGLQVSH